MEKILVVNGPNLNLLGARETNIYGTTTLEDINALIEERAEALGVAVTFVQSNSEGELIDAIQAKAKECIGIIINPGGLTHTSVSLRDSLLAVEAPFIEVHLSNIFGREEFRSRSLIADVAMGQISGLGPQGYLYALESLAKRRSS